MCSASFFHIAVQVQPVWLSRTHSVVLCRPLSGPETADDETDHACDYVLRLPSKNLKSIFGRNNSIRAAFIHDRPFSVFILAAVALFDSWRQVQQAIGMHRFHLFFSSFQLTRARH
jgi:hypothetical protein